MTAMLTGATTATVILLVGILGILGVLALSIHRYRSTEETSRRLVELALSGRPDEARIRARNSTAELEPILDALGGELTSPRRRSVLKDMFLLALLTIPAGVLGLYSWSAIRRSTENTVEVSSVLLTGFAVLLPLSAGVGLTIVGLGRQTWRLVRGSCITLLARSVRTAVESEISEHLRRGPNSIRDPRGD